MSTPWVGFGNDTLAQADPLEAGESITCPSCGDSHVLEDSKPPLLLFYKCGDDAFLAGINGRSIMGRKADSSGRLP